MKHRSVRSARSPRLVSLGFTLVEILVVVVILGIAAAIVVPAISSMSDLTLQAAARHLVADLEYAKNLAITKQRKTSMRLCHTHGHYYVYERDDSDTSWVWIDHPVQKVRYHIYYGDRYAQNSWQTYEYKEGIYGKPAYYMEGVQLGPAQGGSSYEYIDFDEYGSPGSTGEAVKMQAGEETLYVFIAPVTGTIYVRRQDNLTPDDEALLDTLYISH